MITRIVQSARESRGQMAACFCAALLITGAWACADDGAPVADEQQASESPSPADADQSGKADTQARPNETRNRSGAKSDQASDPKDENEGSVDRALRKLATIPRSYLRRSTPADRAKTAGSTQYRLPSGTRVIVIQPGSQDAGPEAGNDASKPEGSKFSDGQVSEPNRLGLQHRDAIRDSVSNLPIGDDINGKAPDWQPEVIEGEIVDRNDPRLRNATVIAGPYAPYRRGFQRLPSTTREYNDYVYYDGQPDRYGHDMGVFGVDNDSPAGEYYRFGFVRGRDYAQFYNRANARTDRLLNSADKFRARGIAYLREGRYRQAANAFKVSAETNQHDPAARLYAAHAYFAIGRYRDAVEFLQRAFELQPKIAYLNYDLRDDYGRKADFDRQLSNLERALDRSPHDVDRLALLGYVLCYTNQRDIAWQPLIKAYKLDPKNGLVRRLMESAQPPDVELEKAGIELPDRR